MRRALLLCLLACFPAMADFRYAIGSFLQGDTSVTVSDVGGSFQPKALILVMTSLTAVGSAATGRQSVGFCASTGAVVAWSEGVDSGGATANVSTKRATVNNRCLVFYEGSSTVAAATVTITSTGFTISWAVNDTTHRVVNYQAWGGSDVSAQAGTITTPASPGNVTTTVGFAPSVVFMTGSTAPAAYPVTPGGNFDFALGMGVGASTATSGVISGSNVSGGATSNAGNVEVAHPLQSTASSTTSVFAVADISATDSTSFTLDFTVATVSSGITYMAIGGGGWAGGRANQPTSTGNQTLTASGFTPSGAMFFSANKVTSSTYTSHARFSIGATDGVNAFSTFLGIKGAFATVQVASTSMDKTNSLRMMTEGGASPTTNATMDTVVFSPNTLTPHWSAVDATAREYVWVAFGAAGAGGGGTATVRHRVSMQ